MNSNAITNKKRLRLMRLIVASILITGGVGIYTVTSVSHLRELARHEPESMQFMIPMRAELNADQKARMQEISEHARKNIAEQERLEKARIEAEQRFHASAPKEPGMLRSLITEVFRWFRVR